jgi:hypothetical protein
MSATHNVKTSLTDALLKACINEDHNGDVGRGAPRSGRPPRSRRSAVVERTRSNTSRISIESKEALVSAGKVCEGSLADRNGKRLDARDETKGYGPVESQAGNG